MDSIVREWLFKLASLYDREVHEAWEPLWLGSLEGADPIAVEAAFAHIVDTFVPTQACPFPVPAHVFSLLNEAKELARTGRAEDAWLHALATLTEQFHPDVGWRGPKLAERVHRAVEAAGGIRYLWMAGPDKLVWAKKEFIECYLRDEKLAEYADLLPAPELQALLVVKREEQ